MMITIENLLEDHVEAWSLV